ncbi:MAG TPA: class I SAM-dependent methyltransferase [Dehalococcoidia bacterium]|nr:class I SAM-dependent methyltransferase [Dehalococcoidia bacterium]
MNDRRRPAHLTPHNAATFQIPGVVSNYHLRTPYPPELAPFLLGLMSPRTAAVLELGCGTGEIARMLAPHVGRIDAVDISAPMLEAARSMPSGDHPAIAWIHAPAEHAPLAPPYGLAISGDALHWMDWEVVLPKVRAALAPRAHLAIIGAKCEPPWSAQLLDPIARYSVMPDFERYDLIDELTARNLFVKSGEAAIGPAQFTRSVEAYVDALHATAGLPRERMGPAAAHAFDEEVRTIVLPHAIHGVLSLEASAHVVWGSPG